MLRLFIAVIGWLGAAHACPKLAGRYHCAYKSGRPGGQGKREDLVVTEVGGPVPTYYFNDSPIIPDGQTRALPDDGDTQRATLRAWCDPDHDWLHAELSGRYFDGDAYGGELDLRFTYADAGGALRQATEGGLAGPGFSYPLDSDVVCTPD